MTRLSIPFPLYLIAVLTISSLQVVSADIKETLRFSEGQSQCTSTTVKRISRDDIVGNCTLTECSGYYMPTKQLCTNSYDAKYVELDPTKMYLRRRSWWSTGCSGVRDGEELYLADESCLDYGLGYAKATCGASGSSVLKTYCDSSCTSCTTQTFTSNSSCTNSWYKGECQLGSFWMASGTERGTFSSTTPSSSPTISGDVAYLFGLAYGTFLAIVIGVPVVIVLLIVLCSWLCCCRDQGPKGGAVVMVTTSPNPGAPPLPQQYGQPQPMGYPMQQQYGQPQLMGYPMQQPMPGAMQSPPMGYSPAPMQMPSPNMGGGYVQPPAAGGYSGYPSQGAPPQYQSSMYPPNMQQPSSVPPK